MTWVAGIDGCRAGWFAILRNANSRETRYHGPFPHISNIRDIPEKLFIIAVDIPIGLLDHAEVGGRNCDREARAILGQPRARSVFSPPVRSALSCGKYENALAANRASSAAFVGISMQCFALFEKIREVDGWMDAEKQLLIREVHPEMCFLKMHGGVSIPYGKKERQGLNFRRELLVKEGFSGVIENSKRKTLRREVQEDDILDACAACWTAERIALNRACVVPKQGNGSQIWF
jgi:predicted RNase H-like nuclease